jgi:hypothetical protein
VENKGITEQEAYEIEIEACSYFYPFVLMDTTRQTVNVEAGKAVARGPMNAFAHIRTFPRAEFRDVVRPNFDTLYSIAWAGPLEGADGGLDSGHSITFSLDGVN